MSRFALIITTLAVAAVDRCGAAEWPHWRGPDMNGVAEGAKLPTAWSPGENIRWRTPLPGPAGSTPVLMDGRLYLTSPSGAELLLMAFDAGSGEEVWRRTVSTGEKTVRGDEGNLASPSPSTDGDRIVVAMGDGTLACYSVDGEPVWRLSLSERLTPLDIQFGYTSTPILENGRVYVQWVHGDGDPATHEARVACFDLASGETLWATPRVTAAHAECEHAYTSPVLADGVLITHGADEVVAYDESSGAEVWRAGAFNPPGQYHPTLRFVASPAVGMGLLVAPTAKKGAVAAWRLDGVNEPTEVWRLDRGTPDVPSPVVADGLVYLCSENGNVTCLDAESGDRIYLKRTVSDRYRSSPLLADGKLYVTSRSGVVTVIRAGREFELLAQNDLGEAVSSSPVPGDGVLYLRTFDALYAIGE